MGLALSHTVFNVLGVTLFSPFLGPFSRYLEKLYPDLWTILTVYIGKTPPTVTDAAIASGDVHITSATSAITLAGTPAAADMLFFQITRDHDHGSDDLDADAKLLGVMVEIAYSKLSQTAW